MYFYTYLKPQLKTLTMDPRAVPYFSAAELAALATFEKIIVWGYPLHTHTQSYIHACWVRTFKMLGKEVYWFHDDDFRPVNEFSYKNCLFIAEAYKEKNIPLEASSTYFINFCIYPQKYLKAECRIFDQRFKLEEFHDVNNDFTMNDGTHNVVPLSIATDYEALTSNSGLSKEFTGPTRAAINYECIYMLWATDLFPWEINYEDAIPMNMPIIHFVGTTYSNPRMRAFEEITKMAGIEWIFHDPWRKPISFEDNRVFVRQSILAPDFRPEGNEEVKITYGEKNGQNHLATGYLPCRLFKNISYGHLPLTDSPHAGAFFGDAVVYEKDLQLLIQNGLAAQSDIPRKIRAMKMIADNHTYVQRVRDLLRAVLQPRPIPVPITQIPGTWSQITLVTSLVNINREMYDGRNFVDYANWFLNTIRIPAPMIIYTEPILIDLVKEIRGSLPTKIISQTLNTIPLVWSIPFVDQIQQSDYWKAIQKNPGDLVNRSVAYSPVIHSKMVYMINAIEENPFGTDMFFWIDAGLSRFWRANPLNSEPHPRTVRDLRKSRSLFAQVGGHKEHLLQQSFVSDQLVGANENILMAGFWGGHMTSVKDMCTFILEFYVKEMIQKMRIDTEQTSWFFHYQQNKDKYVLIRPYSIDYANFHLFSQGQYIKTAS